MPVAAEFPVVAPASVQVCKVTPQLSAVVGAMPLTTALQLPASTFWLTSAGQVIVGFSLSVTVISCTQVLVLP